MTRRTLIVIKKDRDCEALVAETAGRSSSQRSRSLRIAASVDRPLRRRELGTLIVVGATAILYVRDLERMRAFYVGCFDLRPVEEEEDYLVLSSENWELTLVTVPGAVASQETTTDPPTRRERVPVKLGFLVPSIEALHPVLERLGGVIDDLSTAWEFRGTRRCDAADPEGNVIHLLEPSPAPPLR
jgi:catechol 2,3-dioxygenase-like lactoylglutathione lyase family enzyme